MGHQVVQLVVRVAQVQGNLLNSGSFWTEKMIIVTPYHIVDGACLYLFGLRLFLLANAIFRDFAGWGTMC